MEQQVKRAPNGVVYAVLDGQTPQEYSQTDALVMFNPFANTATPNMLVRAEFIREAAKQAGVRDEDGKLKPVVMLASPGIFGSRLSLTKEEKSKVRQGDLGPAAKEYLKAVSALEFGRVALLGFSQGADMALSAAQAAYAANLDNSRVSVGEPAAVAERSSLSLAADFMRSGGHFQQAIEAGGIDAQQRAIGRENYSPPRLKDYVRFGAVSLLPSNRALWSALSRSSFESKIQNLLEDGEISRLVIGYGSDSHISQPQILEPAINRLHQEFPGDRLISVKVPGEDHSWGDNLPLLAKLYLKALD